MAQPQTRYVHPRSITFINNKGGVGKTTLVAHVGGLLAAKSYRVLIVDIDEQGNLGDDLGYNGRGESDEGMGLVQAVAFGQQFYVIRNVRPGLDVIPGGKHVDGLGAILAARANNPMSFGVSEVQLALATALAPIADDYDVILIDCPPGDAMLQAAALMAAAYMFIPTKTDMSSRKGMVKMAELFTMARAMNPLIQFLGVMLFGVTPAAKAIRKIAIDWIREALDDDQSVFVATLRHVEGPAFYVREYGILSYELEALPAGTPGVTKAMTTSMTNVSKDFEAITVELITRLFAKEAEQQKAASDV